MGTGTTTTTPFSSMRPSVKGGCLQDKSDPCLESSRFSRSRRMKGQASSPQPLAGQVNIDGFWFALCLLYTVIWNDSVALTYSHCRHPLISASL